MKLSMQLPDFTQAKVLVVGDLMLDQYWFGDTTRISPEAPVPIVNVNKKDERPGGAANVAMNIAALGAKTTLLGIAGNDAAARKIIEQLNNAHIQHEIKQIPHFQTITKLRVLSHHQQLMRVDFEKKISAVHSDLLIPVFQNHLPNADLIILSDYGKGTLTCIKKLIEIANDADIPVLVDPKGADFSLYRHAQIITPNFKEFEIIVGHCHDEKEIIQKGKELLRCYDIQTLLLTRGECGMTLIQADKEEMHLPAHAREVFDVTGAGDTVISVLGTALAANANLKDAVSLSNLAASLVVTKLGTASVTPSELKDAISRFRNIKTGIVTQDQLLNAVSGVRSKRKRIILASGCFDILHANHVKFLQEAKQLGDYLIVAIFDDPSVARLNGSGRPINNLDQRLLVLSSLGMIDWVIAIRDSSLLNLLSLVKPDVFVINSNVADENKTDKSVLHYVDGEIRLLKVPNDISTSSIIEKKNRIKIREAEVVSD